MCYESNILSVITSALSRMTCVSTCIIGHFLGAIRVKTIWKPRVISIKIGISYSSLLNLTHVLVRMLLLRTRCWLIRLLSNFVEQHMFDTILTLHIPGLIRLGDTTPFMIVAAWESLENSVHLRADPVWWWCFPWLTRLRDSIEFKKPIEFQNHSDTKCHEWSFLSVITLTLCHTTCPWIYWEGGLEKL